ncbi:hypothetical protein GALL_277810 [mine drainage metagenome]|uniref:Uncharacterized protein n=1 Tax=mine drainage metagenome TaxID=410659 RepID=A0A1J5RLC5_9ZZZZ
MLKEWVRNLPLEQLRRIVADTSACHHAVWRLAYTELDRRRLEDVPLGGLRIKMVS